MICRCFKFFKEVFSASTSAKNNSTQFLFLWGFGPRIIVRPRAIDKSIKYEEKTLAKFLLSTQAVTGGNYRQAFLTLNFHICICFCCYFQLDNYICCNHQKEK